MVNSICSHSVMNQAMSEVHARRRLTVFCGEPESAKGRVDQFACI